MNGTPLFSHSSLPCLVKHLVNHASRHWQVLGLLFSGSSDRKRCASDKLIFMVLRPQRGVNLHLRNVRSSQQSPNGLFAFQQQRSGKCVSCIGLVESEKKRLFPCAIRNKQDAVTAKWMEGHIQALALSLQGARVWQQPAAGLWNAFFLLECRCPCGWEDIRYYEPHEHPLIPQSSCESFCTTEKSITVHI